MALTVVLALALLAGCGDESRPAVNRPSELPAARGAYRPTATPPVDPRQLTDLPFGSRSHWLQPWRAYLETPSAARLQDAIGINFNVAPREAQATARLLRATGFRRGRYEIAWNRMDYDRPGRLADPASARAILVALRDHHLRPLILLNANDGGPTPSRAVTLRMRSAAPAGARRVLLDPASVRAVVPGRTGFDGLGAAHRLAAVLITGIDRRGTATLSRPLPGPLGAGPQSGHTLRYPPFAPPRLPGGRPNPAYAVTREGWLTYVGGVTRFVRGVLGSDDFDVEVWNELSFGSAFLTAGSYYAPAPPSGPEKTTDGLLADTVAYLRDPAHGVARVGIGDGFASQTPFAAGSLVPPGVTALDKHPYRGLTRFPADALINTIKPVDAQGGPDFQPRGAGPDPTKVDRFIPSYAAFLPEYFLTAIQTETMVRDLAPRTTSIFGVSHGRAPAPGAPARAVDHGDERGPLGRIRPSPTARAVVRSLPCDRARSRTSRPSRPCAPTSPTSTRGPRWWISSRPRTRGSVSSPTASFYVSTPPAGTPARSTAVPR